MPPQQPMMPPRQPMMTAATAAGRCRGGEHGDADDHPVLHGCASRRGRFAGARCVRAPARGPARIDAAGRRLPAAPGRRRSPWILVIRCDRMAALAFAITRACIHSTTSKPAATDK
jgi:hypothetical protein